jgi:hypothetical protein
MLKLPKLNTYPVKPSLTSLQHAKASEASGCHAIPACALGTVLGAETSPVQGDAMSDVSRGRTTPPCMHSTNAARGFLDFLAALYFWGRNSRDLALPDARTRIYLGTVPRYLTTEADGRKGGPGQVRTEAFPCDTMDLVVFFYSNDDDDEINGSHNHETNNKNDSQVNRCMG